MKGILVLIAAFSLTGLAEEADFTKHKAEVITEIDQHIQKMQENKTCVNAATDKSGLQSCHAKMKEFRKSERMDRLGKRKERIEERMKKEEGKSE